MIHSGIVGVSLLTLIKGGHLGIGKYPGQTIRGSTNWCFLSLLFGTWVSVAHSGLGSWYLGVSGTQWSW